MHDSNVISGSIIKLEGKRTIDLVQFVDQDEIDPRYFEKSYYVAPSNDDVAHEGFAVIREGCARLARSDMVKWRGTARTRCARCARAATASCGRRCAMRAK